MSQDIKVIIKLVILVAFGLSRGRCAQGKNIKGKFSNLKSVRWDTSLLTCPLTDL